MINKETGTGLSWLFLDMNSFFASVEQRENPALRGKPVVVVPMPTDATCAIAASYEARAYGVKTGTKIYEARKMCPGLRCVLAHHDLYVEYHHRVIAEVIRHTPINTIRSIDELDSRLPPGRRSPEKARAVALAIKAGLRQNVGERITASIGIAPNPLLAKIAAEMQKPDGLTVLPLCDLPGPLLDCRLTDIPGIGENMERRLHRAGIRSMEALWHTAPKHMRKIWGSVQGERMWYALHGYHLPEAETGNVMVGHSRMLDPDLRPPEKARLMARRLLTKAVYRLRRKGYYARMLSLGVRSVEGLRWRGEIRVPAPACDPFTFLAHLEDLWQTMLADFAHETGRSPLNLRLLKVATLLTELRRAQDITGDLFAAADPLVKQAVAKRESLARALDHLRDRYKKETVWMGVVPRTLSGHVGTKIAFSRVPEREEFWH